MKKNLVLMFLSIILGVAFTFFILNKNNVYAKEEYLAFAFQTGAFENYDNAKAMAKKMPSSIIVKENDLHKVYVAVLKDIDLVNSMVVYFENQGINIYLKSLFLEKSFYEELINYELLLKNTSDTNVYNKINQSILNGYYERLHHD